MAAQRSRRIECGIRGIHPELIKRTFREVTLSFPKLYNKMYRRPIDVGFLILPEHWQQKLALTTLILQNAGLFHDIGKRLIGEREGVIM